jgi:ribonuclease E
MAAPVVATPAPVVPAAPVAAPAAATNGALPAVTAFVLPVDEMQQVAQGSGLQWVQSDADKVAAIQAAIAAEPRPIHTPRVRPPAVVLDDGPLVLVETRRDLRDMQLPFDQPPTA